LPGKSVPRAPAFAACLLFAAATAQGETRFFLGRAYDPDSGRHLYTEQHRVRLDERGGYISSSVTYVDPRGEPIAVKEVDFAGDQAAPSFRFRDLRTDSLLRVDSGGPVLSVSYRHGGREREADLDTDGKAEIVIDAGFDRFIQQEWEALLQGLARPFLFLHAPRARFMQFEVVKTGGTGETVEFQIRPAGFILGMLVDPIRVTYAVEGRRLLRYRGVTNIAREADGRVRDDHYVARIEYEYLPISTRRY
jgi:hypothetical protein